MASSSSKRSVSPSAEESDPKKPKMWWEEETKPDATDDEKLVIAAAQAYPKSIPAYIRYQWKWNRSMIDFHDPMDIVPYLEKSKAGIDRSSHRVWRDLRNALIDIATWKAGHQSWESAEKNSGKLMPGLPTSGQIQAIRYLSDKTHEVPHDMRTYLQNADLLWIVDGDRPTDFWKGAMLDSRSWRASHMDLTKLSKPKEVDIDTVRALVGALKRIFLAHVDKEGVAIPTSTGRPVRPIFTEQPSLAPVPAFQTGQVGTPTTQPAITGAVPVPAFQTGQVDGPTTDTNRPIPNTQTESNNTNNAAPQTTNVDSSTLQRQSTSSKSRGVKQATIPRGSVLEQIDQWRNEKLKRGSGSGWEDADIEQVANTLMGLRRHDDATDSTLRRHSSKIKKIQQAVDKHRGGKPAGESPSPANKLGFDPMDLETDILVQAGRTSAVEGRTSAVEGRATAAEAFIEELKGWRKADNERIQRLEEEVLKLSGQRAGDSAKVDTGTKVDVDTGAKVDTSAEVDNIIDAVQRVPELKAQMLKLEAQVLKLTEQQAGKSANLDTSAQADKNIGGFDTKQFPVSKPHHQSIEEFIASVAHAANMNFRTMEFRLKQLADRPQATAKDIDDILTPCNQSIDLLTQRMGILADTVGEDVLDSVKKAVAKAVKPAVDEAVKPAVEGAVKRAVDEAIKRAVEEAVKPAVDEEVKRAVQEAVKPAVDEEVKPAVDEAVKLAVDSAVKQAIEDIKQAVEGVVKQAVEGAVKPAVDKAVKRAVEEAAKPAVEGGIQLAIDNAVKLALEESIKSAVEEWGGGNSKWKGLMRKWSSR
jgi:hypothetical protein